MHLSDRQLDRFFDLLDGLIIFANSRLNLVDGLRLPIVGEEAEMKAAYVCDSMWRHPEVVEEYVRLNPRKLRKADLDTVAAWQEKFNTMMDAIIGIRPAYMRAPGGYAGKFIAANVNLPMIQWSINPSDPGNEDVNQVAGRVIAGAHDGGVVLMHDLNPVAYQYTEIILSDLEARNFLCVTVDELFDHYGIPLLPNQAYTGCEDAVKAEE